MKKKYLAAMCLCLLQFSASSFAQSFTLKPSTEHPSIELSLLETSDLPLTSKEHVYLLKALNLTAEQLHVVIRASNVLCDTKQGFQKNVKSVDVSQKLYFSLENEIESTNFLDFILLPKNQHEFYLKLQNPPNELNRKNCTEVSAIDNGSKKYYSNTIVIESFIPNPADFK